MSDNDATNPLTAVYKKQPDGLWVAVVTERPELFAAGRTLERTREALIKKLADHDIDVESTQIVHKARFPADTAALVARTHAARAEAEALKREAHAKMREAARCLVDEDFSLRDAGVVLDGISHTRVQQLLEPELEPKPKPKPAAPSFEPIGF